MHILGEYNWEDHTFSTLHKYDQNAANCINRISEFGFEMTNGCYGGEQVRTTLPFRDAIVKYLMYIHGIVDQYFNYEQTNKYLQREFKGVIKKMITNPLTVEVKDFDMITSLSPEERSHVGVIVMETKRRIELIYVTRTLSNLIGQ